MSAHIFKISGYLVDPNGDASESDIKNYIENHIDCFSQHLHVEKASFEWDDDLPVNKFNCDLKDCEQYFERKPTARVNRLILVGSSYRHFKGKVVKVIAIAQDTENVGFYNVIYKHEETGDIWSRPYEMFAGEVDHEKYPDVAQKYRFEEITE